jgi:hypothetical protein
MATDDNDYFQLVMTKRAEDKNMRRKEKWRFFPFRRLQFG